MLDGVAAVTYSNHLDHLAPVCAALKVPAVAFDPAHVEIARRFYPSFDILPLDEHGARLLKTRRVILHSTRIPRQLLAKARDRRLRVVNCPHGWSDKGWWLKWMALEDVFLAYGDETLRLMQEEGTADLIHRYVVAGDLRHDYYEEHREHFDAVVDRDVFAKLRPARATVLYAPTWADPESPCSLESALHSLVTNLPSDIGLIVKLHPLTSRASTEAAEALLATVSGRAVLLTDYPLVLPLLRRTDVYVGDRSSIGYDFLAYDRPMIFLRAPSYSGTRRDHLGACGREVDHTEFPAIWDRIQEAIEREPPGLAAARRELRGRAFAPSLSHAALREAIAEACDGPRPEKAPPLPIEFHREQATLGRTLPAEFQKGSGARDRDATTAPPATLLMSILER